MSEKQILQEEINSVLEPYMKSGTDFSSWSKEQIIRFVTDVTVNQKTGRLRSLKEGDSCIRVFSGMSGKLGETPTIVFQKSGTIIRTWIYGNDTSAGSYSTNHGVCVDGPDYGWIIPPPTRS